MPCIFSYSWCSNFWITLHFFSVVFLWYPLDTHLVSQKNQENKSEQVFILDKAQRPRPWALPCTKCGLPVHSIHSCVYYEQELGMSLVGLSPSPNMKRQRKLVNLRKQHEFGLQLHKIQAFVRTTLTQSTTWIPPFLYCLYPEWSIQAK